MGSTQSGLGFRFGQDAPRQLRLDESLLFPFLFAKVFPDRYHVPADEIDEEPSLSQPLPGIIPFPLQEVPRQVDRPPSLDVSHYARRRQLQRNVDQHVNAVSNDATSRLRQNFFSAHQRNTSSSSRRTNPVSFLRRYFGVYLKWYLHCHFV